ncbi:hypothetical protein QQF64_000182, partial [Cirrhinus molitorella]
MKIIWTFTLLMIPGVVSSGSVTGYSGGEVNITCKYKKENTANAKYLCKGKKPKRVKTEWRCELIKTEKKDEWVNSGRFSLYDDTRAAVFTVTIRNLSEQDSGTYQCAVDKTTKKDSYTEVKLNIITERNEHQTTSSFSSAESPLITSASPVTDVKYLKSQTETVSLGGEVKITHQIPEEHIKKVNFCKEDDNRICQSTSSCKVTQIKLERNEERVFTVSISNVSVRDAGVYWCGAETRDTYLTFISLTTKIQLNLIMPPVVSHEGESAEIICPYDSIYKL